MNEEVTLEELKQQIQGQREDKIIVRIGVLNDLISQIEKQQAEIKNKDKQIEQYQNMLATNDMLHVIECEKKDTLINTMQAEFERLEDLEDNTDMLKMELEKKDKIINEMAIALYKYANLEVLIQCPAEYDGKYNMNLCRMNLADRNCVICIQQYFEKLIEKI